MPQYPCKYNYNKIKKFTVVPRCTSNGFSEQNIYFVTFIQIFVDFGKSELHSG